MQKWRPRIQSNQFKLKALSSEKPVTGQIALYGRLLTGHLSFKQILSSRFLHLHFPHIPLWTLRSGESRTVSRTFNLFFIKNKTKKLVCNFHLFFNKTCFTVTAGHLTGWPFCEKIFTFQMQFPSERSLKKGYAIRKYWFPELCRTWEFVRSWNTSKKEHRLL